MRGFCPVQAQSAHLSGTQSEKTLYALENRPAPCLIV
jgi:hypothetical protein